MIITLSGLKQLQILVLVHVKMFPKKVQNILLLYYLLMMLPLIGRCASRKVTMDGKFLYFAYGSNLLEQRIHIQNPTAVRHDIGKLKDYQLDFITFSRRWKGASATIIPKKRRPRLGGPLGNRFN
ncbi:hypothetical protein NQ315_011958 [Exocentrus adspersus]|uniref:gamma-glutamylcyclotransferase n=1 Tax=Exocentrus adspersus TaxID=1586481 RepID=A0AAV8W0U8_9CUCU|nr:hypothetical protein NQ315_011958 [Exocentrus adspersus]